MTDKREIIPRYFICYLLKEDRAPNYLRKEMLPPISIELRARNGGLSGKRTYFDIDENEVFIDDHRIPTKVVNAAKNLSEGDGGWFDENGERADFF